MTFNTQQQEAITSNARRIVVSACPGSGKSSTLIQRVVHRVNIGTDPKGIWLITFTVAGAKVMTEKLAKHGVTVGYCGTRHGLLYRILNEHGEHLGYRPSFISIITPEDHEALIKNVACFLGVKPGKATNESDLVKHEVASRLKRANSVSYDMILEEGLLLLNDGMVSNALNVSELLSDESQDNSELDWQIDEAIPAYYKFWTGDFDQAIFSFRGAKPSYFLSVMRRPDTHLITLETNYRSAQSICTAATRLIRHNSDRLPKDVLPREGAEEGEIRVWKLETDREESSSICYCIHGRMQSGYNDTAIITRTNAHADQIRDYLTANGIPVATAAAPKLPSDWPRVIAALNVLLDPQNDLHVEKMIRLLASTDCPLNLDEILEFTKRTALKDGASWFDTCTPINRAFNMPRTHVGFMRILARLKVRDDTAVIVAKRICELGENTTLQELAHDLANPKLWDDAETSSGVHCLTCHASKGREFDCVIVAGCEEEMWCKPKDDEAAREEARRLFFVSVTRARHSLILTWAAQRANRFTGRMEKRAAVRFLGELA